MLNSLPHILKLLQLFGLKFSRNLAGERCGKALRAAVQVAKCN